LLWGVIGNTGLLGSELEGELLSAGQEVIGFNRSNFDLSNSPSELADHVSYQGHVDALVNCLAFAAVDRAESRPDEAMLVNSEYAGKLAWVARELGARFIQISTDYVFDGASTSPYQPEDKPNPQTAYGQSKLAGEIAVQESGADFQIFRTAWLYGANGQCFPKTVEKALGQAGSMKVVADQIGQPTWTVDLAKLIIAHSKLSQGSRPRIVHGTASGQASWFDFAGEIARSLGHDPEKAVQPITTADFPTPAKRPTYSVLDNQNETGLVIGDWRERWKEAAVEVLTVSSGS
jgi:dTDP-4-dehydrorhamnose reductase